MHGPDPFGWVGAIIDDQFAVAGVAGEGSFGVVYRATHLGLDVPVAIKCLKVPPGLQDREFLDLLGGGIKQVVDSGVAVAGRVDQAARAVRGRMQKVV